MKKSLGIYRNRMEALQTCKNSLVRKKNIFKYIGKEEDYSESQNPNNTNHLLSATTTKNSAHSVETADSNPTLEIYDQAKNHLQQVAQYKKKMVAEIKLRMASFKESEIKVYDENISKYSSRAVEHLLKSEKILALIRKLKGSNETEFKFYRNMEKSLALEIREVSKSLRAQEKEYYDRLKAYETGTANLAIQLKQEDRLKMKDDFEDMQVCQTQMGQNQERNRQISDLVRSINQLNNIYKQLNELVIEQGSLIDRIDYNIEETFHHVEKGVVHLKGADQKAESACARKCMYFLILAILVMAIVIGFKLSNSKSH